MSRLLKCLEERYAPVSLREGIELRRGRLQTMSDYLFVKPRAWFGAARLLDLGGRFDEYNYSPTPIEADLNALRADWLAVGNDIREAAQRAVDAQRLVTARGSNRSR